jgi:TrpR-related protein YerC/YecD
MWGMDIFMNSKIKGVLTDKLFQAVLYLKSVDECYNFFEDICTISEIKALAQRLEVAKMLRDGKTYSEISEKAGASTATISRVNKCLNYGADGYKTILDRVEGKESK